MFLALKRKVVQADGVGDADPVVSCTSAASIRYIAVPGHARNDRPTDTDESQSAVL